MSKPEWVEITHEVEWCKDCGRLKIYTPGNREPYRYLTPRRERERRIAKKGNHD